MKEIYYKFNQLSLFVRVMLFYQLILIVLLIVSSAIVFDGISIVVIYLILSSAFRVITGDTIFVTLTKRNIKENIKLGVGDKEALKKIDEAGKRFDRKISKRENVLVTALLGSIYTFPTLAFSIDMLDGKETPPGSLNLSPTVDKLISNQWIALAITTLPFIVFLAVLVYYFKSKKKLEAKK